MVCIVRVCVCVWWLSVCVVCQLLCDVVSVVFLFVCSCCVVVCALLYVCVLFGTYSVMFSGLYCACLCVVVKCVRCLPTVV